MKSSDVNTPQPTNAELSIMREIWRLKEASVRQVWEALNKGRETPVVYTTVLKAMQVMHAKGILERDSSSRSHVYRAAIAPEKTKRQLVSDLVHRLFEGSARDLVAHALGGRELKKGELAEIRALVDALEKDDDK